MRAMAAPGYGPLERLASIDVPLPSPGRGEVRVRVMASALNPADYKVLLGSLKFLHARNRPLIVGYDFSGVVDAVGSDAGDLAVGDEVFGFLPYGPGNRRGAFAEALIAKCGEVMRKPRGVSHERAAAAATTGLTAIQSIRDLGRLPATGGKVLVTGGSGIFDTSAAFRWRGQRGHEGAAAHQPTSPVGCVGAAAAVGRTRGGARRRRLLRRTARCRSAAAAKCAARSETIGGQVTSPR